MSIQAGKAANPPAESSWVTLAGVAACAVAFRVLSACVAFISRVSFPAADQRSDGNSVFGAKRAFWDLFVRWDSGWYFKIAHDGYHYTPEGRDSIGFFPVYPLLMRYVGRLFGRYPADIYYG